MSQTLFGCSQPAVGSRTHRARPAGLERWLDPSVDKLGNHHPEKDRRQHRPSAEEQERKLHRLWQTTVLLWPRRPADARSAKSRESKQAESSTDRRLRNWWKRRLRSQAPGTVATVQYSRFDLKKPAAGLPARAQ